MIASDEFFSPSQRLPSSHMMRAQRLSTPAPTAGVAPAARRRTPYQSTRRAPPRRGAITSAASAAAALATSPRPPTDALYEVEGSKSRPPLPTDPRPTRCRRPRWRGSASSAAPLRCSSPRQAEDPRARETALSAFSPLPPVTPSAGPTPPAGCAAVGVARFPRGGAVCVESGPAARARGARRLALARRRRDGPAVSATHVPRHARGAARTSPPASQTGNSKGSCASRALARKPRSRLSRASRPHHRRRRT